MEAVGLASSIVALLGVARKLATVVGSLLGKTAESTVLTRRIIVDLTAVHECLEHCSDAGVEDLREACSALEVSLTACLSSCMNLSAEGDNKVRRFKALFFRGRTRADIVVDLKRIELDVSALLLRFLMKGLVRTEITATKFRDEVHLRLDSIENVLKQQTSDKGACASLLGTLLHDSLTMDLFADSSGSSTLRSEIRRALRDLLPALRKYIEDQNEWESDEDSDGTKPYPSSQRNDDVILETPLNAPVCAKAPV